MMKSLDWQSEEIVNIYDDVSLWSAPFGKMLLENIPMRNIKKVLDLGFGTGFPIIELAQCFGKKTAIIGIEVWQQAILRTREKIRLLGLTNIQIIEQSAAQFKLPKNSIDLVCSNLGVNNFENKALVYKKVFGVLKPTGSFCFTTNDNNTFQELFNLFEIVLDEMGIDKTAFNTYINHRSTAKRISTEIERFGFKQTVLIKNETHYRFADSEAVFNHSLVRIAFAESWKNLVPQNRFSAFILRVRQLIADIIKSRSEFRVTVPMLYFQFDKT
ncbi:MAG: class I SAM-dependent methyltransferase [Bacteroidia bacterium]